MDHLDLVRRQADPLDLKPGERLRDRDDARRTPREDALDETKRSGAKGIVVVLRRDEAPRANGSVDVRMDEMRVHELCRPRGATHAERE